MLKLCKIHASSDGTLGLHLSRAPWDPYPWVSGVQDASNAFQAGVRSGDTVLELNGCDVLGQKIAELAAKIQSHWQRGGICVTVLVWRNKTENNTINQQSLQKFARCLQHIAQLLECPVCLEVVKPPGWQCCNGHVLCNSCRGRTVKCPICRVTLGPRGRCLLADKLFTLLAESFPCDGVRNGKSSANCQKDYKGSQEMPIITANVDSRPVSTSSSPSLDKVHQQKQLVGNKISEHIRKSVDDNNHLTADVNSPDSNIVVLQLNQKSRKKSDIAENGSCHHHHHHYYQQARHHCRSHSHSHSQSHQSSPPLRIFHCPTGKSSCSLLHNNVTTTIIASNNSRLDDPKAEAKTLDSIWSQEDGSRKQKGEEKIETLGKFITEWDILSHLTQVHQISVAQHYTTFGQAVRLQFPNANSIPCITIQSERTWNQNQNPNKENYRNNVNVSVGGVFVPTVSYNEGGSNQNVQEHTLERRYKNSRTTTSAPKNVHRSAIELFFVACLPLGDDDSNSDQEEDESRNKMNDVNADATTLGDMAPSHCNAAVSIADTARRTYSQTTGHLIQLDEGSEFFTANLQSRVRVNVEHSPASSRSLKADACTWCSSSSSSSSCSSSLASFSMSSSSSNRCCSNTMTPRQHAIFIWYFGNECDVKNFRTVIECKRTGLQWTGCVHPLTECWSSIRQRHQQSDQHQFLLLDSMPDGGDNFFDIVIKTK